MWSNSVHRVFFVIFNALWKTGGKYDKFMRPHFRKQRLAVTHEAIGFLERIRCTPFIRRGRPIAGVPTGKSDLFPELPSCNSFQLDEASRAVMNDSITVVQQLMLK